MGILIGLGFWTLALFAGEIFEKDSAPARPRSVVHRMVVELERDGDIEDFRSVEPEEGWDTEYEVVTGDNFVFGGFDGFIRIRGEGRPTQALEYEAYTDSLEDAMEEVIRAQGFRIEG